MKVQANETSEMKLKPAIADVMRPIDRAATPEDTLHKISEGKLEDRVLLSAGSWGGNIHNYSHQ